MILSTICILTDFILATIPGVDDTILLTLSMRKRVPMSEAAMLLLPVLNSHWKVSFSVTLNILVLSEVK